MDYLITLEEFKNLARPASIHLDESHVMAYVREAEDAYIIPAIGYETVKGIKEAETITPEQDILLNGGEFTTQACGCDDQTLQYCKGLKLTVAYYAYAKMMRADGSIVSRAGFMRHEDDYSRHVDDTTLKQYNDVMDMAERYLASCLSYMASVNSNTKPVRGSRARIYAIGE